MSFHYLKRFYKRKQGKTGSRIYVRGISVNKVKKAVGKLAKKVQLVGQGVVEVIHSQRPPILSRSYHDGLFRLKQAIKNLEIEEAIRRA